MELPTLASTSTSLFRAYSLQAAGGCKDSPGEARVWEVTDGLRLPTLTSTSWQDMERALRQRRSACGTLRDGDVGEQAAGMRVHLTPHMQSTENGQGWLPLQEPAFWMGLGAEVLSLTGDVG